MSTIKTKAKLPPKKMLKEKERLIRDRFSFWWVKHEYGQCVYKMKYVSSLYTCEFICTKVGAAAVGNQRLLEINRQFISHCSINWERSWEKRSFCRGIVLFCVFSSKFFILLLLIRSPEKNCFEERSVWSTFYPILLLSNTWILHVVIKTGNWN